MHQGHPIEAATDVSMMTRAGVERIMRFAFKLAQSHPRKLLTVITKSNAQRHAMVMWDEIALQISKEFPDVTWDKELVDASTARMINRPASLDTIVATNLHADILSDLAAALAGSLGIAPTGNIDPEHRYPSMFEPIHGSAFDIMGKGLANPVGTFWSVVMLLEHLGESTPPSVSCKRSSRSPPTRHCTPAIWAARRPPLKSPRRSASWSPQCAAQGRLSASDPAPIGRPGLLLPRRRSTRGSSPPEAACQELSGGLTPTNPPGDKPCVASSESSMSRS